MNDNLLGFWKSIIIGKSQDGLYEQFISFYLIAVVMNYTKCLYNHVTVLFHICVICSINSMRLPNGTVIPKRDKTVLFCF